jgi:hypothetical protein
MYREEYLNQNWNKLGYMQDDTGVSIIIEDGIPKLLFKIPASDVNPYLCLFSALTSVNCFNIDSLWYKE